MFNSPLSLFLDLTRLTLEAQQVIGMRLVVLASGGKIAHRESQRMVTEKLDIAARVLVENSISMATGASLETVGIHTLREYGSAVSRNHERLLRG